MADDWLTDLLITLVNLIHRPSSSGIIEYTTLKYIWLYWAGNWVKSEVKVLAAAHKGEACFASDYTKSYTFKGGFKYRNK
jgi:hypothetical protein